MDRQGLGNHCLFGLLLIAITLAPAAAQKARPLDIHNRRPYQKWLDEDVRYIITDQERSDFSKLTTDKQHDDFVEAFWERRNPTPGSAENAFKEEHYRRLAYANTHFAAGVPGWKTDRGRLYVIYGKPDSIDSHPTLSPPFEEWHYRYIEGMGKDLTFRLVDTCGCGDYHLPVEKDEMQK
ncbi:MAG: GWxTD domain-containing protein [Candidatus Sulfotelmatobacter sp.]